MPLYVSRDPFPSRQSLRGWEYSNLPSPQPIDVHLAALVDVPNACATLALPTKIFDRDITPNGMGPDGFEKRDYGQAAIRSDGQRAVDIFAEKRERQEKASKAKQ